MYVRNEAGQVEVNWTTETTVALVANTRLLSELKRGRFDYKIHSSKEVHLVFRAGRAIMGIKRSQGGRFLEQSLEQAKEKVGSQKMGWNYTQSKACP